MTSWADGPLLAFDLETTGTDPATDRVVTATVISIEPGRQPRVLSWLASPGVPIPPEATEVHRITDEYAREHGRDAATVISEVAAALAAKWSADTPLCAFNASFDLSMLHAELRRHHQRDLVLAGPVVDPHCIDRQLDRYRKGKRTLAALCEHHRVRLDDAHSSAGDALATARLAWRLARTYPDQVGGMALAELHALQVGWHRDQQQDFANYLDRLARQAEDPAEAEKLRLRAEGVRAEAQGWPLRTGETTSFQ
ncbi:3'-5' exonuclease [Kutzneria viridogrisea]|uniref:DNA polymerase-3 subunit epsilon n=1 Tax=Kutzneria viridogrisea TaxID=47990 RepID=A0ABR6BLF0_9PSEU|nr:DNA polymerase-3 subunit epsilon [Kutzneria viridogrisea]